MPSTPRLILASRSPRRAALLTEWGYAFEQADPPFDDPPQPSTSRGLGVAGQAMELACRKVLSLREAGGYGDAVLLAADTICVGVEGSALGQPRDRDDARAMLGSFIGRTHDVVTGMAVLGAARREPHLFADTASVNMGLIDPKTLEAYLNTDQWRGKAGGYNLFDRQKAGWPITVHGDETTVVGLPMRRLSAVLARLGCRGVRG